MKTIILASLLLAGCGTAQATQTSSLATDVPEYDHEMICELDESSPGNPQTLQLNFKVDVLAVVDFDIHGEVEGTFTSFNGGQVVDSGPLTGGITPKLWYGGGFDVDLDGARFLILRERNPAQAFVWFNNESVTYTCTGNLPR